MEVGEVTVNNLLSLIEDSFYLLACDDDTPAEEMKGNIDHVRDGLHRIMILYGWMNDPHVLVDLEFEEARNGYEHSG